MACVKRQRKIKIRGNRNGEEIKQQLENRKEIKKQTENVVRINHDTRHSSNIETKQKNGERHASGWTRAATNSR